jgi:two-component system cell cycle sensor histidine kinase/response regulator CckA
MSDLTASVQTAPDAATRWREWLLVAVGVVASALVLWLALGQPLAAAAYALGVACLAAALGFALRRRRTAEPAEFAAPDWSVTHAAIDRGEEATAIIDRAGRLACANARFADCFGTGSAPPRLGLEGAANEAVEAAARAAWRDGHAAHEPIRAGGREWRLEIDRAGRGQDFLIWRFAPVVRRDPLTDVVDHIRGKVGKALAREGIQTVAVAPDGRIHAANSLFAARATGDAEADVTGSDFVGYFSADEHERIFYAREGTRGPSVRMLHVPVADPEEVAASAAVADPAQTASLFLLIDNQGGVGDSRTGLPQIEALEYLLAFVERVSKGSSGRQDDRPRR